MHTGDLIVVDGAVALPTADIDRILDRADARVVPAVTDNPVLAVATEAASRLRTARQPGKDEHPR